jgi:hypothetical protein
MRFKSIVKALCLTLGLVFMPILPSYAQSTIETIPNMDYADYIDNRCPAGCSEEVCQKMQEKQLEHVIKSLEIRDNIDKKIKEPSFFNECMTNLMDQALQSVSRSISASANGIPLGNLGDLLGALDITDQLDELERNIRNKATGEFACGYVQDFIKNQIEQCFSMDIVLPGLSLPTDINIPTLDRCLVSADISVGSDYHFDLTGLTRGDGTNIRDFSMDDVFFEVDNGGSTIEEEVDDRMSAYYDEVSKSTQVGANVDADRCDFAAPGDRLDPCSLCFHDDADIFGDPNNPGTTTNASTFCNTFSSDENMAEVDSDSNGLRDICEPFTETDSDGNFVTDAAGNYVLRDQCNDICLETEGLGYITSDEEGSCTVERTVLEDENGSLPNNLISREDNDGMITLEARGESGYDKCCLASADFEFSACAFLDPVNEDTYQNTDMTMVERLLTNDAGLSQDGFLFINEQQMNRFMDADENDPYECGGTPDPDEVCFEKDKNTFEGVEEQSPDSDSFPTLDEFVTPILGGLTSEDDIPRDDIGKMHIACQDESELKACFVQQEDESQPCYVPELPDSCIADDQTYNDLVEKTPGDLYGDFYSDLNLPLVGDESIVNGTCCTGEWCGICPIDLLEPSYPFMKDTSGDGEHIAGMGANGQLYPFFTHNLDSTNTAGEVRVEAFAIPDNVPIPPCADDQFYVLPQNEFRLLQEIAELAMNPKKVRKLYGYDNSCPGSLFMSSRRNEACSEPLIDTISPTSGYIGNLSGSMFDDGTHIDYFVDGNRRKFWESGILGKIFRHVLNAQSLDETEKIMNYLGEGIYPLPQKLLDNLPIDNTAEDVELCRDTGICPLDTCLLFPNEPGCDDGGGSESPPETGPLICQQPCPAGSGATQLPYPNCSCICESDGSFLAGRDECPRRSGGSGGGGGRGDDDLDRSEDEQEFRQTNTINGGGTGGNSSGGGGGGLQQLMESLF